MKRPTGEKVVRSASVILSLVAIAVVGLLLLWYTPPPVTPADRIEHPPPDLFERPPLTGDITIATPAAAERRRQRLQRYVFGQNGIPDELPVVARGVTDWELAAGLTNLERINKLTIALPLGFKSVAYHLIPRRANQKLLIYHNGHRQDFSYGTTTIAYFLRRGYALLVFAMPFAGLNTNPETVETTRCGRVELAYAGAATPHDALACVSRPLRFFVEPLRSG